MFNQSHSVYLTLQTSVAILFSTIVGALGLVFFLVSYFTFGDLVLEDSTRELENSTEAINLKFSNLLTPYSNYLKIIDNLHKNQLIDFDDKLLLRRLFLGIISANPAMYSIYIAKPNGSFFQIKKNLSKSGLYIEEDFDRDHKPEMRTQSLMDSAGKVVETKSVDEMQYDPRKREWYLQAKTKKSSVWSSIYQFAIKQQEDLHGITHAQALYNDNGLKYIFGIDVETNDLVDFMEEQKTYKTSEMFLIDNEGEMITSTKLGESKRGYQKRKIQDYPKLLFSFSHLKNEGSSVQKSSYDGTDYLIIYEPVEYVGIAHWTIGHVVDSREIAEPIRHLIKMFWKVMVISIFSSIMIAVAISRRISSPVNILADRAKKLAHLVLEENRMPDSRIKEIRRLSRAFKSMTVALGSFIKYMPSNLVKKLLIQKMVAEPGGETRRLPIMFLDFENFIPISESMPPDKLMGYLSGYLECMTHVIHDHDGTVDKYIGGSIMVFWGAPGGKLDVNDYTRKACECALEMLEELHRYNKKMHENQFPQLQMRIGLNVGEMTVGNLGSSDRLSYTVIGDNVNLASRLESLCKYYHSKIVVSESVFELAAETFNFLLLDCVKVKGKNVPIKIYELGKQRRFSQESLAKYMQAFNYYLSGDWEQAFYCFQDLYEQYPDEALIQLYIRRISGANNKPPYGWDGSWTMEHK